MGQSSTWKLKIIISLRKEKYLDIINEIDADVKVGARWWVLKFKQIKRKTKIIHGEKEWRTIIAGW